MNHGAPDSRHTPGRSERPGSRVLHREWPNEPHDAGESWTRAPRVQAVDVGPSSSDHLSAVARGGLANLVGAVLSAAANFGLTMVVAHFVSTAVAGVFFTVTSLFLMLESLGRLGADTGLVYFVARWRALRQEERIYVGLRASFGPVVGLCSVLAVGVFVSAPQLARLIDDPHGHSVGLLRLLAVLLPLTAAYDVALGATRGFGWMLPTVLVEKIGRSVVQMGLVTGVLVLGWSGGLGYAWALPYIGGFVAAMWMLRTALHTRLGQSRPQRDSESRPVAREFWSFALPRAVAGVAQIVLQRFDIVLVASMRGAREAAIYTAATRFLVVGQFLNQAITAPVQPHMSAALSSGDATRARQLYQASTAWLVLVCWPLFGLVAALGPVYVGLFGHSYRSGASVVVILSVAMLIASAVGLVDTVIIMAGKTAWNLGTTLLALVVNVAMDFALIPHLGLIGAALGWFGSIMAANLVPLLIAWRHLGMHPFGRSTYLAYLLCGVCWIVLPAGAYVLFQRSEIAAATGAALGAAIYCAGLWRWRNVFGLGDMLRKSARGSIP